MTRCGRGGIRTHGGLPHARFRVECLKPDSATLPCRNKKTSKPACAKKLRRGKRRTSNIQSAFASCYGAPGIECNCLRQLGVQRWALDSLPAVALCEGWVQRLYWRPFAWISRADWQTGLSASRSKKMLQLNACHVWQVYCILYVHTDSHAITCC